MAGFDPDLQMERELREGFSLLDPPHLHRPKAVVVAWRIAREAALQRGLLATPGTRLSALCRLNPSPWSTNFGYEVVPQAKALVAALDQQAQPLLPVLSDETWAYFQAVAGPIRLDSTPSGRLGLAFLTGLVVSSDEVNDQETALLEEFGRDTRTRGLAEARMQAKLRHGFSERETTQLMAMHLVEQAQIMAAVDDKTLARVQLLELDALASRMSQGVEPDLRGAAMARREIARLLTGTGPGDGGGGLPDIAPLAQIAEENGAKLPTRPVPIRAEPQE